VLNSTFLARSEYCILGNNVSLSDPISGNMRHLLFSRIPFKNSTIAEVHSMPVSQDQNILGYFRFDRYSQFNDTYRLKTNRNITFKNVALRSSFENEHACYCFQEK
jgi:hypothetical protein